ncbi:hypothetical protein INR49_020873, partial [Caranx melampygus]
MCACAVRRQHGDVCQQPLRHLNVQLSDTSDRTGPDQTRPDRTTVELRARVSTLWPQSDHIPHGPPLWRGPPPAADSRPLNFVETLPTEMSVRIFRELDTQSLVSAALTCRLWHYIIEHSEQLWRNHITASSASSSSVSGSTALTAGTMDDVPPIINIAISLRIQPTRGPLFFKVDGTRFGQSRTIKLLTGSKYKIEVVMKPGTSRPRKNQNRAGPGGFCGCQSRDQDSVVYHGQYDTEGVPHTKSGDRQPVQFNKAGTFETVWQAKYYNYYKREHCQFGNKFSSIEYECKPNETRTLMWINKESQSLFTTERIKVGQVPPPLPSRFLPLRPVRFRVVASAAHRTAQ